AVHRAGISTDARAGGFARLGFGGHLGIVLFLFWRSFRPLRAARDSDTGSICAFAAFVDFRPCQRFRAPPALPVADGNRGGADLVDHDRADSGILATTAPREKPWLGGERRRAGWLGCRSCAVHTS